MRLNWRLILGQAVIGSRLSRFGADRLVNDFNTAGVVAIIFLCCSHYLVIMFVYPVGSWAGLVIHVLFLGHIYNLHESMVGFTSISRTTKCSMRTHRITALTFLFGFDMIPEAFH